MFMRATAFNGDISKWDVTSVANMKMMFLGATSFERELCGAAWIKSKASENLMFEGSSGSISSTACTPVPRPVTTHATRRPISERELIVRTPITNSVGSSAFTCPKCGTFLKSGRISCCAPGGAWYKDCGGVANKNVDHSWTDGMEACKRKFEAYDMP